MTVKRFNKALMLGVLQDPVLSNSNEGLGLYRNGYRNYGNEYWGFAPASGVSHLVENYPELVEGKTAIDIAAGTGKNSFELIRVGAASVVAVEIDSFATLQMTQSLIKLEEAGLVSEGILKIYKDDAISFLSNSKAQYELAVCYGLLHVFKQEWMLQQAYDLIKRAVKPGGALVLQSLTDKYPAPLSQPELEGVIVREEELLKEFSDWEILWFDSTDITHSHAGAEAEHKHGSVRLIAKKGE